MDSCAALTIRNSVCCADDYCISTTIVGILLESCPSVVLDSLSASVPFPKRLGKPEEFASLALEMARNTYLNGQSVRLDGAIRMAPR